MIGVYCILKFPSESVTCRIVNFWEVAPPPPGLPLTCLTCSFQRRFSRGDFGLRQIVIVTEFFSGVSQHLDALLERDTGNLSGLGELELVNVIDAAYKVGLLLVPRIQLLEDEQHKLFQEAHDLMVVLLEFHFQIEASELSQMAGGITVLGAKDWADFLE